MRWNQAQSQSAGVKLNDILANAKSVGVNQSDFVVRSACGRWDECETGDLFFAINEADIDGHDYIDEATSRGARGVVCERLLPVSIPQFVVKDSRAAYAQICQALSGDPSQRVNLIGVAGSVGKTVTSHLIHSILEIAGRKAGLSSSIEVRCGDAHRQLPGPINAPTVASQLSKMCIANCSDAVVEMPSVPLAQRMYSGICLDAAIVTNVQPNNLEVHGNLGNCQRAIYRIMDYLKPTGFAVVNADDKYSRDVINGISSPMLTFGMHNPAEVTAKIIDRNRSYQTFVISAGGDSIVIRTNIIGKHHIYNCLAAATVALTIGIDLQVIAAGLQSARIPGRLQRVDCGQEFGVWIDSSVSPNQLNGAIAAIAPICEGRIWCVCSTAQNQTADERRILGEILERKIDQSVISQLTSTKKIDYEPCHQILDGFENPALARVMPDRCNAIEWVLSKADPKDVVLIVGAGERTTGPFGHDKKKLTDREICQTVLCNAGSKFDEQRPESYRIDDYR